MSNDHGRLLSMTTDYLFFYLIKVRLHSPSVVVRWCPESEEFPNKFHCQFVLCKCTIIFLPPANEVIFSEALAILFTGEGGGSLWCHLLSGCLFPCSFQGVSGPMFLPAGSLSGRPPQTEDPPYGKKRMMRILLEGFLFQTIFGGRESLLWGHWYPCFELLVTSLGFKARVGSLIYTWWRCTWCMFHGIYLWCDTCWILDRNHDSGLLFPTRVSTEVRMPDSNGRPPADSNALSTWFLLLPPRRSRHGMLIPLTEIHALSSLELTHFHFY